MIEPEIILLVQSTNNKSAMFSLMFVKLSVVYWQHVCHK